MGGAKKDANAALEEGNTADMLGLPTIYVARATCQLAPPRVAHSTRAAGSRLRRRSVTHTVTCRTHLAAVALFALAAYNDS